MRVTLLTITILAAVIFTLATNGDEPQKRSAELQVLDRFVGEWDFDVTNKLPNGQSITGKTSETRTWSLGGKFVRFENPQSEKPDEPEFQMLITYDPATKTYPGFLMSGSSRSVVDGTWDPAKQIMTFRGKSTDSSGVTFVYTNRFTDNDHWEVTGIIKDAAGKVIIEQIQEQRRRKK